MGENSGDLSLGYMMGQSEGNGGGWGNFGEGIWAVVIIALLFGRGGFGGGGLFGGGGGNPVTTGDLCSQFNFNDLQRSVQGIQQGICDSTYAINNTLMSGFHGVDNAICNLGYQTQSGFNALSTQMANCCCETQRAIERGFCDTNYNMATNTRDIIEATNCGVRSILDFLTQDKIATLQAENQSLKFQASQSAQNNYLAALSDAQTAELVRRIAPMPVPSYTVPAPYPYCGGSFGGYGGGCGCGC